MIVIIDYGMGNLGSISNCLKSIGAKDIVITSDLKLIKKAKKIILPGVGNFKKAMENIKKYDMLNILNEKALVEQIPILGICLGMQLFFDKSEEGNVEGLGWIKGDVVKLRFIDKKIKIPHMGWNYVELEKISVLTKNLFLKNKFYFVHSYHCLPKKINNIIVSTMYNKKIVSGIQKQNIFGFQFHPEKSHKYGKQIFDNFNKL